MSITNANVAATATTVYTSSGNTVVSTLHLCNVTGSAAQISVRLVPSGGTPGANNTIYSNLTINANDTHISSTERFVMGNGDFISATANTANAIISTVTYASV